MLGNGRGGVGKGTEGEDRWVKGQVKNLDHFFFLFLTL